MQCILVACGIWEHMQKNSPISFTAKQLQHFHKLELQVVSLSPQGTLKAQIMQRYRNIRRTSSAAKAQKLKGIQLPPIVAKPAGCPSAQNENNREMEEAHQESIKALQKLFEGRASVPNQTVQSLLDSTRPHREQWLRTPVSIDSIIQKYPAFKLPKWVRMHVSGCKHTALTCTGFGLLTS